MILDYSHDYMNQMMDWGSNGWIILVLGGAIFLLFIIILLYFLSRGRNHQENFPNNKQDIIYNKNELLNIPNSYSSRPVKDNVKSDYDAVNYCPACGEKINGTEVKFCPFCGARIL
ncbi:MAG: hypothetical protein ACFFA8_14410 [Promethearchaeota archaeon]